MHLLDNQLIATRRAKSSDAVCSNQGKVDLGSVLCCRCCATFGTSALWTRSTGRSKDGYLARSAVRVPPQQSAPLLGMCCVDDGQAVSDQQDPLWRGLKKKLRAEWSDQRPILPPRKRAEEACPRMRGGSSSIYPMREIWALRQRALRSQIWPAGSEARCGSKESASGQSER